MKTLKENILPIILIALLAFSVFHYFESRRSNKRLHTELIGKTEKIEFLNENVAYLERLYINQKDLTKLVRKQFNEYAISTEKRIKILSNATFLIREKARKTGKSDIVYRGKRLKYIVNEIRYENGPAVGYVLIFDDGRVVSKIYNHEIDVKTLVARNEANGKYDVVTRADYVLKSPAILNGWLNKPYPLKIKGGKALIDPTEPVNLKKQFYFWNPQLNANINANPTGVFPGLGVSLMGYGYTKRDLDFKFLQFGTQYNNMTGSVSTTFTPILWRPLPKYLNNTYIGSGITFNNSKLDYYMGLQLSF